MVIQFPLPQIGVELANIIFLKSAKNSAEDYVG